MENKTAALKGVKFGPFEGIELPSLTRENLKLMCSYTGRCEVSPNQLE